MSLPTPATVQKLQTALHAKAKGEPKFRFYALYDKVYRKDVSGPPGDAAGPTAAPRASMGRRSRTSRSTAWSKWLEELAEELRDEDVPAAAGTSRVHSETGRQATAAGHPDDQGSRRANGGVDRAGADLRGGLAAGAVCLSCRTAALGRGASGASAAQHRSHGSGGCRLERLLRYRFRTPS